MHGYADNSRWQPRPADYRPGRLLAVGKANPKVGKQAKENGFLIAVLHLAPAKTSGYQVCASSSAGCRKVCLNTAGQGGICSTVTGISLCQETRKARTRWLFEDRESFLARLGKLISNLEARAKRLDMQAAVRLNGTSDLPWLARHFAERFPNVQFYDYTKHPRAWERVLPNYHLTFSRSETNAAECFNAIKHGINVAVPFHVKRGAPLPATYLGRPVIDGDTYDMRFLDPSATDGKGIIVGLRAKGKAKKDRSGFVVQP